MRGGERCLEVFCELFPHADLYTLSRARFGPPPHRGAADRHLLHPAAPDAERRYRSYPAALSAPPSGASTCRVRPHSVLSHAVAKGVRVPPGARHVCYCFTPMRYVWDLYDDYFGARAGRLTRVLMPGVAAALRRWDRRTAAGVHHFVGISRFIADRIRRCYGREADVIYPPVDVARFRLEERPEDFYLVVSALAPYKRIDLAVEAASRLGRRLLVVGTDRKKRSASPGRPLRAVPRLEGRWPGGGALRALPRAALSHRGGLRHHPAGGHGGRPARDRAGAGRRAGDRGGAGRIGAAHRALLRPPDGGRSDRRHPELRVGRHPLRAQGAAPPRGALRPADLQGARGSVSQRGAGEARAC